MPPSVSAALVLKRGTQGLTLEQLNRLREDEATVTKITDHIEEQRQAFLSVRDEARQASAAADERMAEARAAEASLAARETAAEEAHSRRLAEIAAADAVLQAKARAHEAMIAQHEEIAASQNAQHRAEWGRINQRDADLAKAEAEIAGRCKALDERSAGLDARAAALDAGEKRQQAFREDLAAVIKRHEGAAR